MSYSYRRKRHCGHCHRQGHDRRTCPVVTKNLQERLRRAQRDGRAESHIKYYADELAKRTGIDPLTGKTVLRTTIVRRCSYCKATHGAHADEGIGHTRRTCKYLKADKVETACNNAVFRQQVLEQFRRDGIGVGTLVAQGIYGYFSPEPSEPRRVGPGEECAWRWKPDVLMMVKKVAWENINFWTASERIFECSPVDRPMETHALRLPYITNGSEKILWKPDNGWSTNEGRLIGRWHSDHSARDPDDTINLRAPVTGAAIKPPRGWSAGGGVMLDERIKNIKA
jgi:hypothetical protein